MSTLAGFLTFVRSQMGISTVVLPDASPSIAASYLESVEIVNLAILDASTLIYDLAVYNLAGDILINNASDKLLTNSSITWLLGVATVTTSTAHGLITGTDVVIAHTAPAAYSGSGQVPAVPVIVTGSTTFTYALAANPGTCTQAGTSALTYFADLRRAWNITGFAAGVVQASNDESTGQTLLVQDAMKNWTMADLQYSKTPFGRQYLAYAQRYSTLWGLT